MLKNPDTGHIDPQRHTVKWKAVSAGRNVWLSLRGLQLLKRWQIHPGEWGKHGIVWGHRVLTLTTNGCMHMEAAFIFPELDLKRMGIIVVRPCIYSMSILLSGNRFGA